MRQRKAKGKQGKDSTYASSVLPTTQGITPSQKQILDEVNSYFMEVSGPECVKHLNWLLTDYIENLDYVNRLGGSQSTDVAGLAEITYHATRLVTLVCKLQEITTWSRQEMMSGGEAVDR